MLALAVPLGLLVGLSLGALGGGGSILTVPALVYLLAQSPKAATTSSLLIVGATTLIGMVPHLRAGRARLGQGLGFGLLGVVGTSVASFLATGIPSKVLLLAFVGLMLVVAALMSRRRRAEARRSGTAAAPTAAAAPIIAVSPFHCDCRRLILLLLTATGIGLLTGFFGVGGGFAVVPALVLALRLPMPVAVGTSLVVINVNSATGLAARLGQGRHLDWPMIATFAAAAVVGSLLGGRITSRVSPSRLNLWFTVLLSPSRSTPQPAAFSNSTDRPRNLGRHDIGGAVDFPPGALDAVRASMASTHP